MALSDNISQSTDRRGLRRFLFIAYPSSSKPPPDQSNPLIRSTERKKGFTAVAALRGLGCASGSQAYTPAEAAVRSSTDWQGKRPRRRRSKKKGRKGSGSDVWCAPGIPFAAEASVDCLVAHRPTIAERINRERTYISRRTLNQEQVSPLLNSPPNLEAPFFGNDILALEQYRYLRGHHRTSGGLEEILMFESGVLSGAMAVNDRYRDLRLNIDNMSYEQLLELGDKIGYVSTGLKEEDIIRSLKLVKQSVSELLAKSATEEIDSKCSICQEEYGVGNEEIGNLNCGHSFHAYCIKQWLLLKNACPICKTQVLKKT